MSNPFAAQLPLKELQESYNKEFNKLQEMIRPKNVEKSEVNCEKQDESMEASFEKDENQEEACSKEENTPVNQKTNEKNKEAQNEKSPLPLQNEEIDKQRVLVEYLKLIIQAAELIISTLPLVCSLLKSITMTDVLEAIEFTTAAFQFGLREAVVGIKGMMRLIFSTEPTIKNAVVAAYRKLYLTPENVENEKQKKIDSQLMAKNLILFLHGATESEVFAIEEFIKEFTKNEDITQSVIDVLWKKFEMQFEEGDTENESLASLVLLSMISSVDQKVILKNVPRLVSVGLGPRAENDFLLVRETCSALMKIDTFCKESTATNTPPPSSNVKPFRLQGHSPLFLRLSVLLREGVGKSSDSRYCLMAEKAIALIFKLADCPEKVCYIIIQGVAKKINRYLEEDNQHATVKSAMFVRFLFLCGHSVLCYTIYLENDVIVELKRRQNLKQELRKAKQQNEPSIFASLPSAEKNHNETDEVEFEGTEAEDEILSFINKVLDEDVLDSENFFGALYKIVVGICKLTIKTFNAQICTAASLALAKFMCVSSKVCEENMQLMMTLLEKSQEAGIRSNIIIAMGDLMMRFPNVVQPWTPNLYKRLGDESAVVRLNTLIILTHLILHDMIKVKGQISDVALCMVDNTEEIVVVVRYLFKELSKKKNALYNLLPDLISGLSDLNKAVSQENFEIIMKYIFQYIEKEKEVEGLVEKLCVRVKDISSVCQLQKIMFSLTLFNMSEKCFRKLLEHKDCFKNKLEDEISAKLMKDIIVNAKKHNAKLEDEINVFANHIGIQVPAKDSKPDD